MVDVSAWKEADDDAIIREVCSGNNNVFAVLMDRYTGLVVSTVRKQIPAQRVQEVVQDAFVRACFSLPSFKEGHAFGSWLTTITVRTCYDFWRKEYASKETATGEIDGDSQAWIDWVTFDQAKSAWEQEDSQREAEMVLGWALGQLSPEDRMVVTLTHLDEYSIKEAADMLGWNPVTVKVRAFRARKKLKSMLEKLIEEDGYER